MRTPIKTPTIIPVSVAVVNELLDVGEGMLLLVTALNDTKVVCDEVVCDEEMVLSIDDDIRTLLAVNTGCGSCDV